MFQDIKNLTIKFLRFVMKWCASRYLARARPEIIAITGSVGKTSTKEAVWTVLNYGLKNKYTVRKSAGNLNNELGAPLGILGFDFVPSAWQWPLVILRAKYRALFAPIPKKKEILVLELAADSPGDIEYLTSFIKPKISIITAIGPCHLEQFKTLENIANEKGILAKILPASGFLVIPKNDSHCSRVGRKTKANVIRIDVAGLLADKFASIAAEKIGEIYKIDKKTIKESLRKIEPIKGRMNIIDGIKGVKIIDSTYNANPLSVELALGKLGSFARAHKAKRKIAVLGDMLELGEAAEASHLEMASLARKNSDIYIAVGELSRHLDASYWFRDSISAGEFLKGEIKKEDIILVKGSQGLRMERIVEQIMAEPERAGELLVRQSGRWKATL